MRFVISAQSSSQGAVHFALAKILPNVVKLRTLALCDVRSIKRVRLTLGPAVYGDILKLTELEELVLEFPFSGSAKNGAEILVSRLPKLQAVNIRMYHK